MCTHIYVHGGNEQEEKPESMQMCICIHVQVVLECSYCIFLKSCATIPYLNTWINNFTSWASCYLMNTQCQIQPVSNNLQDQSIPSICHATENLPLLSTMLHSEKKCTFKVVLQYGINFPHELTNEYRIPNQHFLQYFSSLGHYSDFTSAFKTYSIRRHMSLSSSLVS